MKASLRHFVFLASLAFTATLLADDAKMLAGKWSGRKVNEQGQPYNQTIEIKQLALHSPLALEISMVSVFRLLPLLQKGDHFRRVVVVAFLKLAGVLRR
jgi:hypothetical protein